MIFISMIVDFSLKEEIKVGEDLKRRVYVGKF